MDIVEMAKGAYEASFEIADLITRNKNDLLLKLADELLAFKEEIFAANNEDVLAAKENNLPKALVDRLKFNDSRFLEMVDGVKKVAALPDLVGEIYEGRTVESTLTLYKKRVPLGVVGVIYEARPNVTVDIASLCLKSGNACVLRGGKEALKTNLVLVRILHKVLKECQIDPRAVTFIDSPDRELIKTMLSLDSYIDVIIPRGGEALHRMCVRFATMPVIVGGFGVSHIFVDKTANLIKAVNIIINSKVQKPSACNALDTLLLHEDIAVPLIDMLLPELEKYQIEIYAHGDIFTLCKAKEYPYLHRGDPTLFDTEWLSLALNIAAVEDVKDAVAHLRRHKAHHSDSILTDSCKNAEIFCNGAGSACVYVNASTRFTDGGQFGMGAEVAISTQKLHVRGPMGLKDLTTYKYICKGDYLCRK
ncbi:glutamate-5-semialdehyde dehydrogenase [Succinatimonas hippei]|uniref:glutamate-5-semialdehyde dehydrogenase n=1 Tax=Succinatimonas hippei TaxID=626938 RepID=UPI002012156C|nr:glutamate-5-semialdehyde dehydrogenase [Succinatimonas hippei]MCL1603239.1 glutamate-5-semialdehyde dehydrogenase [Succinatimonas hippei]